MIHWQELTIDMFVQQLRTVYQRTYGDINSDYGRIVAWCGRLVLENIANSDALYHDIDHTIMVSLAETCRRLHGAAPCQPRGEAVLLPRVAATAGR